MGPESLKAHLLWLSTPYAEILSDYERINQFVKWVPDLIAYVNEMEEKAAMYDGLCD
jgi:hypothetical protein